MLGAHLSPKAFDAWTAWGQAPAGVPIRGDSVGADCIPQRVGMCPIRGKWWKRGQEGKEGKKGMRDADATQTLLCYYCGTTVVRLW